MVADISTENTDSGAGVPIYLFASLSPSNTVALSKELSLN